MKVTEMYILLMGWWERRSPTLPPSPPAVMLGKDECRGLAYECVRRQIEYICYGWQRARGGRVGVWTSRDRELLEFISLSCLIYDFPLPDRQRLTYFLISDTMKSSLSWEPSHPSPRSRRRGRGMEMIMDHHHLSIAEGRRRSLLD